MTKKELIENLTLIPEDAVIYVNVTKALKEVKVESIWVTTDYEKGTSKVFFTESSRTLNY